MGIQRLTWATKSWLESNLMREKVLNILQEIRPEYDFEASKDFIAEALLDSFDMVVLINELEDVFGMKIDGTEVVPKNFVSVDAIIRLIETCR